MVSAASVPARVISNIGVIERVTSSISVLGSLFIIFTFCFCKAFDRPMNRLIAFASIGNIMSNVATLLAGAPRDTTNSFLCQAQGFLIQMFMSADVLWMLAMAINVYLTFYHKFDVQRLRQVEKWYFLACYGVPFIPAVAYLFVEVSGEGAIYGDAILWCWVKPNYWYLRVATFYAPIWIVVLATAGIYIRAGSQIWTKRGDLTRMINAGEKNYGNNMLNPYDLDAGMIYEPMDADDEYGRHHPVVNVNTLGRTLSAADKRFRAQSTHPNHDAMASVTVTSEVTTTVEDPLPEMPKPMYEYHIGTMPMFPSRPKTKKKDKINRKSVEKQPRGDQMKEMMKRDRVTTIANDSTKSPVADQANRAAWGYTKVSATFFAAMLITWAPSSANRMYSATHSGDISIPLMYAAAFVLPLQGMWNCIIYCVTSSRALKDMGKGLGRRRNGRELREKEEDEIEMVERTVGSRDVEQEG